MTDAKLESMLSEILRERNLNASAKGPWGQAAIELARRAVMMEREAAGGIDPQRAYDAFIGRRKPPQRDDDPVSDEQ